MTQRQDSLYDQMVTVLTLAREAGCYDAYDWIADRFAASDWSLIDGHLRPPENTEAPDTNIRRMMRERRPDLTDGDLDVLLGPLNEAGEELRRAPENAEATAPSQPCPSCGFPMTPRPGVCLPCDLL